MVWEELVCLSIGFFVLYVLLRNLIIFIINLDFILYLCNLDKNIIISIILDIDKLIVFLINLLLVLFIFIKGNNVSM